MSTSHAGGQCINRELGRVTELPRSDRSGNQDGKIFALSDEIYLSFDHRQDPGGLIPGDLVSFERIWANPTHAKQQRASQIRRVTGRTHTSEHFELLATSRDPCAWRMVAVDYLRTLSGPEQVGWLKQRAKDLKQYLPNDAWHELKPQALQDREIWSSAPDEVCDRERSRLRDRLEANFLGAVCDISDSQVALPSDELNNEMISFVKDWTSLETGLGLDDDQAAAVAKVSGDVRVVARAGSGKTRAIVTRAIFLQKHCKVQPGQMLLLAFNDNAAKQIKQRLKKVLGDDLPHVMTYHALAHALVHPEERLVYDQGKHAQMQSDIVQEVIDEHISSASDAPKIRELMLAHFREDWKYIEGETSTVPMEESLSDRRSLVRETLKGEYVKSFGEQLIANTLFEHDIRYVYESNFRWSGINYRPDFMIGDRGAGGVIIEYFGLTGVSDDYDDMSERKRQFWAERKEWQFLEYSRADIAANGVQAFVSRLIRDLQSAGLRPHRLDEEQIWKLVEKRSVTSFTKAMSMFVTRCRKQNINVDELRRRAADHACFGKAERLFLDVAPSVYSGYLDKLADQGKEDFDGLIWRAVSEVNGGSTRFVRDQGREQGDLMSLRVVMVDEFQDFSEMFWRFLEAIRAKNSSVDFFCVGDDWQAINSFAGADLTFFENFEAMFRNTSTVYMRTNWRSDRAIVRAGNNLMKGLGECAFPRPGAGAGECIEVCLDEFQPSGPEEERHERDEFTPAVVRIVAHYLNRGMDVVMLSRRNRLPSYEHSTEERRADGLDGFLKHVQNFLPEADRRRVTVSTTHKYKGLEKPVVLVLDAVDRSYPLVHPRWVFLRLFGDSIDRIIDEERRLFYVALTRAEKSVVLLTENELRSPFLDHLALSTDQRVEWSQFQPTAGGSEGELIEVRVHNAFYVRDQLKQCGFSFVEGSRYWRKTLEHDSFDFKRDILSQPWVCGSVRIEVYTEAYEILNTWP